MSMRVRRGQSILVTLKAASAWSLLLIVASAPGAGEPPTGASARMHTPLDQVSGAAVKDPIVAVELESSPIVLEIYEQAQSAWSERKVSDARRGLRQARSAGGENVWEVNLLLARAHALLGERDEAIDIAEHAARLRPEAADGHLLLGRLYLQAEDRERAIRHFRSATLASGREVDNPSVTLAWYRLGTLLERSGYLAAAAAALQEFDFAIWETHSEHRNADAIAALLRTQPRGALDARFRILQQLSDQEQLRALADAALERWPDDPAVCRVYVRSLLASGQTAVAFDFARERLSDPRLAGSLLSVAIEAARAADRLVDWVHSISDENPRLAGEIARQLVHEAPGLSAIAGAAALAEHPDDVDLLWRVADARERAGDISGALITLIDFVRQHPEIGFFAIERLIPWVSDEDDRAGVPELLRALGAPAGADFASEFVQGGLAGAAEMHALSQAHLAKSHEARPDFLPLALVEARLALGRRGWEDARQSALQVIEKHADLAAAHLTLAQARDALDDNDGAATAYKEAIKLAPDDALYAFEFASHLRRIRNLLGAQRYFQRALAIDPSHAGALEALIDSYLRGGKAELAKAQFDRADKTAFPADTIRRIETMLRFVDPPFSEGHLASLESQVDLYPHDLHTARVLAAGMFLWNRQAEASELLERILAADPDDYHTIVLAANVRMRQGRFEEAIDLLDVVARRYPNRREVLGPLARVNQIEFRIPQARALWSHLIELSPEESDTARTELMNSYVLLGDYQGAIEVLDDWIAAGPEREWLIGTKLELLLLDERADEALQIMSDRLAQHPEDSQYRAFFVRFAKKAEAFERLEQTIRTWMVDTPNDAELTGWLIDVLLELDRADQALALSEKFAGSGDHTDSLRRRAWLGRCKIADGEVDDGLAEFDALIREETKRVEPRRKIWELSVSALIDHNQNQRAIERLNQWLAAEESTLARPGAILPLQIRLLLDDERYDEAMQLCDTWLEDAEKQGKQATLEPLGVKTNILQAAGRDREFLEVMEQRFERSPDDAGLNNDLGYLWIDTGVQIERASKMIRKAYVADPLNAAFIDSVGWAEYKSGNFAEARKHLGRAVRLATGQDPVLYDHLADAAFRDGDGEQAALHWNKALSILQERDAETLRPNDKRQIESLQAKLEALRKGQSPAVAPLAPELDRD